MDELVVERLREAGELSRLGGFSPQLIVEPEGVAVSITRILDGDVLGCREIVSWEKITLANGENPILTAMSSVEERVKETP